MLLSTPAWALALDVEARVARRIGSKPRTSTAAAVLTAAAGASTAGRGGGACLVPAVECRGGTAVALVARPKGRLWKASMTSAEVGSTLALGPLLQLPATAWVECGERCTGPDKTPGEQAAEVGEAPVGSAHAAHSARTEESDTAAVFAHLTAWVDGNRRLVAVLERNQASASGALLVFDVDAPSDARCFALPGELRSVGAWQVAERDPWSTAVPPFGLHLVLL